MVGVLEIDRNKILRDMIKASPSHCVKCFTVPVSWEIDESKFEGYEFSYSKWMNKETACLSDRCYRDEDLFFNEDK